MAIVIEGVPVFGGDCPSPFFFSGLQVMKGVLSNHHTWSPALMQLVGDVVPPVLSAVLKNRPACQSGRKNFLL